MKLLENWKLLIAFIAVLSLIFLVYLSFYPLDFIDESIVDEGGLDFFGPGPETENQQPSTPEELERILFIKKAKENMIPIIGVCVVFLAIIELTRKKQNNYFL